MKLKDLVTIVIPAKNEEKYIEGLIMDLVSQEDIRGTKVYVADGNSTDKTAEVVSYLSSLFSKEISIELIKGGSVSRGRNAGLEKIFTKYVIFIDADVRLTNNAQIKETVHVLRRHKKQLVSCHLKSRGSLSSKIVYSFFNLFNFFLSKFRPFALGSYFATETQKIIDLGKWDESLIHSEDWELSGKFNPESFSFLKYTITVDDRRFKKMGYLKMGKMMVLSFFLGSSYRKKDNGYWK